MPIVQRYSGKISCKSLIYQKYSTNGAKVELQMPEICNLSRWDFGVVFEKNAVL